MFSAFQVKNIGYYLFLTNLFVMPLSPSPSASCRQCFSFFSGAHPSVFTLSLPWFSTICEAVVRDNLYVCVCPESKMNSIRWGVCELPTCEAPWASLCSALCVCVCVCVVERWGTEEVGIWLEQLSLGEYRDTFTRHDIRGSELLHLERRDLKVGTYIRWICVSHLVQQSTLSLCLLSVYCIRSDVLPPLVLCCTALLGFYCLMAAWWKRLAATH